MVGPAVAVVAGWTKSTSATYLVGPGTTSAQCSSMRTDLCYRLLTTDSCQHQHSTWTRYGHHYHCQVDGDHCDNDEEEMTSFQTITPTSHWILDKNCLSFIFNWFLAETNQLA